MDIVSLFDSKLKNLEWEEVYLAREIMNICWYFKWERFNWAILRAINDEKNSKNIENHIFHVIKKDTWWRPKEDYYLSLEWVLYVLEKCDQRKNEVILLSNHIKKLLNKSVPIKKENKFLVFLNNFSKNFKLDYFYIFLIISLLTTSWVLYYFNQNNSNLLKTIISQNESKNNINKLKQENKTPQEKIVIIKEEKVQQEKLESYDKDILRHNFLKTLNMYIEKWVWELHTFDKEVNKRSYFSLYLTWTDLIDAYFEFWNKWIYRESCSLLSKKWCLSSSKSDLSDFSNFWKKTKSWYEVIDVYDTWKKNDKNNEVFCVKYRYKLKDDSSDGYITEVFNYSVWEVNWVKQIEQRYCEKIDKNWKNRPCPFELKNYYCN